MNTVGAVLGGVLGGVLGAGLWAGIVYFTGYEVGYVAWAIGLFVGFGVSKGAGGGLDAMSGGLAVLITVLALGVGKYATVHFGVEQWIEEEGFEEPVSDQILISDVADAVVEERGEGSFEWPDVDPEGAELRELYPAGLWKEAETRWSEMTTGEQTALRTEADEAQAAFMSELRSEVKTGALKDSFSPMDLLFLALAVGTAWKMGKGAGDSSAEAA